MGQPGDYRGKSINGTGAGTGRIVDVQDAPTIGTASDVGTNRPYNNGSATVSITKAATGGNPDSYTVTSSPGSFTATGNSPVTVTGLQSATEYTFTATSTGGSNSTVVAAIGTSNSITATTVPSAPTIGTATTSGTYSATVAYTAGDTGGKAVSAYTATSSPGSVTATGASPISVSGLQSNIPYTFTVTATNANGTSISSSASNSITTTATTDIITHFSPASFILNNAYADSSGNVFSVGSGGGNGTTIAKQTSTGSVSWQRKLQDSTYGMETFDSAIDASGNPIIAFAVVTDPEFGNNFGQVAKYNTSGTLQWQNKLGNVRRIRSVMTDSSSNIYLGIEAGANDYLAKINSSGVGQWQLLTKPFTNMSSSGAKLGGYDSSLNIYYGGNGSDLSGNDFSYIAKLNSSGVGQWGVKIKRGTTGATYNYVGGLVATSTGDVYVTVQDYTTTGAVLIKFNTSGTIQWQRIVTGFSTTVLSRPALDASGNIYFFAGKDYSGSGTHYIVKYNSTGTLQWARGISQGSSEAYSPSTISVVGTKMYIAGWLSSPNVGVSIVLPTDGSKTGTYTLGSYTYTYSTASLTDNAGSMTITTGLTGYAYSDTYSSSTSTTPESAASLTISNINV